MSPTRNPGRVAGLWYLLLVILGPLTLIYIPHKLFDYDNPAATAANLIHHQTLFRVGMADDLLSAFALLVIVQALYRLLESVDRRLAIQVVILGGLLPALLYFVNIATDATALLVATGPASLSAFSRPQQEALVLLLLRFHGFQNTAAESLWGAWLIPLAILTYRSRFLPKFLGIWLAANGLAYITLSLTGLLLPQDSGRLFAWFQPALFGEMAFMLWLVVKGATPHQGLPHG